MGQALGVDDEDAVALLQMEVIEVQAAADVALAAIRQARSGRNNAGVRKLRDELRRRRDRIVRLVDAIYWNAPAADAVHVLRGLSVKVLAL